MRGVFSFFLSEFLFLEKKKVFISSTLTFSLPRSLLFTAKQAPDSSTLCGDDQEQGYCSFITVAESLCRGENSRRGSSPFHSLLFLLFFLVFRGRRRRRARPRGEGPRRGPGEEGRRRGGRRSCGGRQGGMRRRSACSCSCGGGGGGFFVFSFFVFVFVYLRSLERGPPPRRLRLGGGLDGLPRALPRPRRGRKGA